MYVSPEIKFEEITFFEKIANGYGWGRNTWGPPGYPSYPGNKDCFPTPDPPTCTYISLEDIIKKFFNGWGCYSKLLSCLYPYLSSIIISCTLKQECEGSGNVLP